MGFLTEVKPVRTPAGLILFMVKMTKENLINVLPNEIAASTELTNAQKRVMGQLIIYSGLDEAKENDGWFYRSNDDLCNDVECDKKTLITAVNRLFDYGFIDRRAGSRTTGASEYKVLVNSTHSTHNSTHNSTHSTNGIELLINKLDEVLTLLGGINSTLNSTNKLLETLVNSEIPPIPPINSTPDTDTDITNKSTTNETNSSTYCKGTDSDSEVTSSDSDDVCSPGEDIKPDNIKFQEQYTRIQRAVREVQTTNDQVYIGTLQRVIDDASEKALVYASEKQIPLVRCRIEDFQKFANACETNVPEWIDKLPDATSLYPIDKAFIYYMQAVKDGLYHTANPEKRDRYIEICLVKAKKTFTQPFADDRKWDIEKASSVVEGNYRKQIDEYLNTTKETA